MKAAFGFLWKNKGKDVIDTIKLYMEYCIMGVLAFMSFLTLWFTLERYFFFLK